MNSAPPVLPVSDFDFEFPEELVAAAPAPARDASKLLAVRRDTGHLTHRVFRELPELLRAGDCLVLNDTKVLPCRLQGKKASGGKADLLLVRELGPGTWTALSSGLKAGKILCFAEGLTATVEGVNEEGEYILNFSEHGVADYLERQGLAPLPPYIAKRKAPAPDDLGRYQTVYASVRGSIAAPTAGLHFTPELLAELEGRGVRTARLTLHVGRGTFKPIVGDDAASHEMLPEWFRLEPAQAAVIESTRRAGGRVVAVGTTSTRTLETLALRPEGFGPGQGWSRLFIRPGHDWKVAQGLITNFHLPRSTPLMLASAFLGREKLLAAYAEAFARRYRLYSYGDAMLIL